MRSFVPLPRTRPAHLLAIATLALLLAAALAADLLLQGPLTRADPGWSESLRRGMQPGLTRWLQGVSDLGDTPSVLAMAAAAAAGLVAARAWPWLVLLAAAVPGGMVLNFSVKDVFARARPVFDGLPVSNLVSYSFPSAHTAGTALWWGFACVLWFAWQPREGLRWTGAAAAAVLVLATAFSRVYLGFHYVTDVVAAMLEAVAWLCLCLALSQRVELGKLGARAT